MRHRRPDAGSIEALYGIRAIPPERRAEQAKAEEERLRRIFNPTAEEKAEDERLRQEEAERKRLAADADLAARIRRRGEEAWSEGDLELAERLKEAWQALSTEPG